MSKMTLNQFQNLSARTMMRTPADPNLQLAIYALGLAGETGEIVELIKKHLGHGIPLPPLGILTEEFGDVLWYLAAICTHQGISLEEVAKRNVRKLEERYPNGFINGGGARGAEEPV